MIKTLSRFAIKFGLIPCAYYLIRAYFFLIKVRSVNEDKVLHHLRNEGKMIVAIWHQRIILILSYAGRFSGYKPSVMISQSRDGEMISDIASRLNFRPVRGSSSRGGKEALSIMVTDLAKHPLAAHVLDGPRGPRGIIKPGLIVMAQSSGVPICPIYVSVNKAWVLNSWDRMLIPKPFSTITVRWDDLICVPEKLDSEYFERIRKQIENRMKENQIQDDEKLGLESPLR
jgi:lysophospholipid acyltransferase (LPLAT)-like uncharacterized protein